MSSIRTIRNDYSTYTPLDTKSQEIRLLAKVESESPTFLLFTTTLSDAPPYRALSYCWGDLDHTLPVQLAHADHLRYESGHFVPKPKRGEGVPGRQYADTRVTLQHGAVSVNACTPITYQITINLYHALQSVFDDDDDVDFLWADMLCINQGDTPERSAQVSIVRSIFAKANSVVVWLGIDPDPNTSSLFDIDCDRMITIWDFMMEHGFAKFIRANETHPGVDPIDGPFTRYLYWNEEEPPIGPEPDGCYDPGDSFNEAECSYLLQAPFDEWHAPVPTYSRSERLTLYFILWILRQALPAGTQPKKMFRGHNSRSQMHYAQIVNEILQVRSIFFDLVRITLKESRRYPFLHLNLDRAPWWEQSPREWLKILQLMWHTCSNTWFQRVWTVQEAASNKKVDIRMQGSKKLSWNVLEMLWDAQSHLSKTEVYFDCDFRLGGDFNISEFTIDPIWRRMKPSKFFPYQPMILAELLRGASTLEVTDVRDKIFAIYQLAIDLPSSFTPDYGKSVSENWVSFTLWVIKEQRSLEILHLPTTRLLPLPSWIPDYSRVNGTKSRYRTYDAYRASGDKSLHLLEDTADNHIRLMGVQIGAISCYVPTKSLDHSNYLSVLQWVTTAASHNTTTPQRARDMDESHGHFFSLTDLPSMLGYILDTKDVQDIRGFLERAKVAMSRDPLIPRPKSSGNLGSPRAPPGIHPAFILLLQNCLDGEERTSRRLEIYDGSYFVTYDGKVGVSDNPLSGGSSYAVVILYGSNLPFVLEVLPFDVRSEHTQGVRYRMVGSCYVDGVMNGEIFDSPRSQSSLHETVLDFDAHMNDPFRTHFPPGTLRSKIFTIV
ncbi:heterokaryon incompatibility protein-domain-containing protein [Astrocystis sublimbata]|nr:heterokaryon incompatibility protein-domain-containing protein [Astrocystis sublimbata]